MRRWGMILAAAVAASVLLYAVTVNGSLDVLGRLSATVVDFTGADSTAPMKTGTSLPPSCAVGQAYFKTDAAAGQNIYLCTATNTWSPVAGSGGTNNLARDGRYMSSFAEMMGIDWNVSTYYDDGFYFKRTLGTQNLNNPQGPSPSAPDTGVMSISTTSTSGNATRYQAALATGGFTAGTGLYFNTSLPWEVRVRFRYPQATDSSGSSMAIGLTAAGNSTSSLPPLGLGVRYLAGSDSSLTFYTSGSDGVWTSTMASGVAPGTQFHTLRIRSDGSQSYRLFLSLNGGAEVAVCPSGCALSLGSSTDASLNAFAATLRTDEAAQKILQLDYVSFWLDRGATR